MIELKYYISELTPRMMVTIADLRKLLDSLTDAQYTLDVIELMKDPHAGYADQIFATPTLLRIFPAPKSSLRIVGDLRAPIIKELLK